MMWLLLLIFLEPVPGFHTSYLLRTFETYEACQTVRDHVSVEMADAYPDDRTMKIVCIQEPQQ